MIRNMKIDQLVAELKKPGAAMILVIGGADTGKTSLIEELVDELSRESLIGIVDADIGQTHLGPPTTVAWGKVKGGFKGWDRITIEDFYFTGAISPPGNLLPLTVGTKLMADKALAGCDRVFVDTTGLVEDPVGRVLKQQKIDILAPDV
jgi:polynucleotide 5'-hydroxyl-kinase GRC3/NOL9